VKTYEFIAYRTIAEVYHISADTREQAIEHWNNNSQAVVCISRDDLGIQQSEIQEIDERD